jgi:hypothetical protein
MHMCGVFKMHRRCHNIFTVVPFLLGTIGTGIQGKPMEIGCVERSKMGFLSFHTTAAIRRDWRILHSKVLCSALLKATTFPNAQFYLSSLYLWHKFSLPPTHLKVQQM